MNTWQIPAPGLTIATGGIVEVRALITPGNFVVLINGRSLDIIMEEMKHGSG